MTSHHIHIDTRLGAVHLTTPDLQRALRFYVTALGLKLNGRAASTAILGTEQTPALVVLNENPGASRYPDATGLHQFGLKLPNRYALGRSFRRIVDLEWPIHGAADHLVCEAIYLRDLDDNLLHLYVDRPREQWGYEDGRSMTDSLTFDLDGLLSSLHADTGTVWRGIAPETVMGRIDLRVDDLAACDDFYINVLGFAPEEHLGEMVSRVSTGNYYYHIAYDVWTTRGASPAPPDAFGLRAYEILLPDEAERDAVLARLRAAGYSTIETQAGWLTRDPAGIGLMLGVAAG